MTVFDTLTWQVIAKRSRLLCMWRQGILGMLKGLKEEIEVERHRCEGLVIYEVTRDELESLKIETLLVA
jgi:hypothetical protein